MLSTPDGGPCSTPSMVLRSRWLTSFLTLALGAAALALVGPSLVAASTSPAPAARQPADGTIPSHGAIPEFLDQYLNAYFLTYPTAATAAGRHDLDGALENLSPQRLTDWAAFNRRAVERAATLLSVAGMSRDDRLDLELLARRARHELHDLEARRRPQRDPLFWTGILGDATLYLILRDA